MKSYLDYMRHVLEGGAADLICKRLNEGEVRRDRNAMVKRISLGIINEANLTGGDNVGGDSAECDSCASSTDSPAQEVAASDDDGGDGDGEDDRRRPGRPRNTRNNTFPAAAEHFDRLPDSALVGIATVKALTSKSRATIYRWMDRGLFPRPCKIGTTHNLWRAGDIRRALSA